MRKKKRHIGLKIAVILSSVLALILVGVGVLITDFTDNTPSYYSEMKGVSVGDYLGEKANASLRNCGPFDDFEYLFNQEEINRLLATIVPNIQIPMVNISSIYLSIDENDCIHAEAPFWALFYKSCAKADGYLSYDETTLTLEINELKVNLLTSQSGIVAGILSKKQIADIADSINGAGVHLKMEKKENTILVTMTNIDICRTIVDCCSSPSIGFLSAAITAGALSSRNVKMVVNEDGLTGVIVKKSLL